jgi:hypothetical protein
VQQKLTTDFFGRSQVEKGTKLCRFDGCGESDFPPPQQSDTNTQALLEELMEEGSHSSSSTHVFAVEHSGRAAQPGSLTVTST